MEFTIIEKKDNKRKISTIRIPDTRNYSFSVRRRVPLLVIHTIRFKIRYLHNTLSPTLSQIKISTTRLGGTVNIMYHYYAIKY